MTNYENKIKRIEEILNLLEENEISLEENVKLVEEGTKLASECKEYLDNAELKINKIVEGKEENFK